MEMTKIILSKNMKAYRKVKGWNQDELAEATGYSTGFIKDVERGKSWVSPEALEAIAKAFKVDIERLFESGSPQIAHTPVSASLKKMLNVPDKIYDLAEKLGVNHELWGHIEDILQDEIEYGKKKDLKDKKA